MSIFVAFEGCDGSGKSTAIKLVYEKLIEEGYDVVCTREPGGIGISEQIRDVILNVENTSMDPKTEALLYAASRRQHLVEKIIPALQANKIVLCDRFVHSSLAYQGYARNLGIEEVYNINKFAIDNYMPDMVLFLDVDAKTGLNRIKDRASKDRLDKEKLDFHEKVFEGYRKILSLYKDDFVMIDASKSISEVFEACYKEVKKAINV